MLREILLHSSAGWADWAILIGRLFVGVCFVIHGLGKLGVVGPGGPDAMSGFVAWLKSLGVPLPEIQARIAMLSELVGGTLIALGCGMRFGALLCLGTMIVAASIGHRGGGYLITNNPPGNEYTVNLAAFLIVLILLGPGIYSVDYWAFGAPSSY
jgi:putative oxidoreductase